MKRLLYLLALSAAASLFTSNATASNVSTNMNLSATVVPACTVSASVIDFGQITGATAVNVYGTITVNCSSGLNYRIALDAGAHYASPYRGLTDGANNRLNYNLCKDAGCNYLWGDTGYGDTFTTGTPVGPVSGSGTPQNHIVVGELLPGIVPLGSYSDTVMVTVIY